MGAAIGAVGFSQTKTTTRTTPAHIVTHVVPYAVSAAASPGAYPNCRYGVRPAQDTPAAGTSAVHEQPLSAAERPHCLLADGTPESQAQEAKAEAPECTECRLGLPPPRVRRRRSQSPEPATPC